MLSVVVDLSLVCWVFVWFFFFQAEDGIRDLVRSRGLGDVYKRQVFNGGRGALPGGRYGQVGHELLEIEVAQDGLQMGCLLYTSDAADERSSVDLGGRRIIKKKNKIYIQRRRLNTNNIRGETNRWVPTSKR